MPELSERVDAAERAVETALYNSLVGGYEVIDTPAGITLIGPVEEGHSRDIFIVQVLVGKVEVA